MSFNSIPTNLPQFAFSDRRRLEHLKMDTNAKMPMDPIGTPRRTAGVIRPSIHVDSYGSQTTNGTTNGTPGPGANTPSVTPATTAAATLWARYEHMKHFESSKDVLLEEVLTRYENLARLNAEFEKYSGLDVSMAHQLEKNKTFYDEQYTRFNTIVIRDPFVNVLIDGNAVVFDKRYLCLGEDGGVQAAHALQAAVQAWAAAELQQPCVRVAIRIYADADELANACELAKICKAELVDDFVAGFTLGDPLCDFINVGPGKDRATIKMTAHLNMHLHDVHCKQVIFGCSYDLGLAKQLEALGYDEEAKVRLTLLEGVPLDKELLDLPFKRRKFANLFRETKLPKVMKCRLSDLSTGSRPDSRNTSSKLDPKTNIFTPTQSATPFTVPGASAPPGLTRANSVVSTEDVPETTSPTPNNTWSKIAGNAAALPFTDIARPVAKAVPLVIGPCVLLNKQGYRLDKHMEYDHDKVFQLKQVKLCNQHYIGKGCCHYIKGNNNCPHVHDRKLSNDELKWLRVVSRETVCKKGVYCRDVDCIYGHRCPYPNATEGSLRGIGCVNGTNCRFAQEMHGMDVKVDKIIPAGSSELDVL